MKVQEILIDIIVADFLQPTIDRLSEQLRRNIWLRVTLMLDKEKVDRLISTTENKDFIEIHGDVRIVASDTAIEDRYKYSLQCVFPVDPELCGLSGIRMKGAVILGEKAAKHDYPGFMYTYNEWDWGKVVRDF